MTPLKSLLALARARRLAGRFGLGRKQQEESEMNRWGTQENSNG